MSPTTFYRAAVVTPLVVFGVPVLVNRLGASWFGGVGTTYGQLSAVSMYFGGIPYTAIAAWAWWWIGGKTEAAIRRLMWRTPPLMTAAFLLMMIPWGLLAHSLDAWWSLSAIGAVMCLGLGYGWVLATVIARRILSGIIR